MPKTDTEIGRVAAAQFDRKIFLSKPFLDLWLEWRTQPSKKIQFNDLLSDNTQNSEEFLGNLRGLLSDCSFDLYERIRNALVLATTPKQYRSIQPLIESYFREVSSRPAI